VWLCGWGDRGVLCAVVGCQGGVGWGGGTCTQSTPHQPTPHHTPPGPQTQCTTAHHSTARTAPQPSTPPHPTTAHLQYVSIEITSVTTSPWGHASSALRLGIAPSSLRQKRMASFRVAMRWRSSARRESAGRRPGGLGLWFLIAVGVVFDGFFVLV